jgi:hypothetical protein
MSENVGASTSHNPMALYGLYRDNFTFKADGTYSYHCAYWVNLICVTVLEKEFVECGFSFCYSVVRLFKDTFSNKAVEIRSQFLMLRRK